MDKMEIIQMREDNLQHLLDLKREEHLIAKELDKRTRDEAAAKLAEAEKRSQSGGTTRPPGGPAEQ